MSSTAFSTAIGGGVISTGLDSISVAGQKPGGIYNAQADGVAVGNSLSVKSGSQSVCVGFSSAVGDGVSPCVGCVCIGPGDLCGAGGKNFCVCIGRNCLSTGSACIALGNTTWALGNSSVGIGNTAQSQADFAVALGPSAVASALGTQGVCVGRQSSCTAGNAVALGYQATVSGASAIALGPVAIASASNAISIGNTPNNAVSSSALIGDPAIANIRPNNTGLCDLGTTTASYKACYLKEAAPAMSCNYVQQGVVNVNATTTETSVSSGAAHVGSLSLALAQTVGTVVMIRVYYNATVAAGNVSFWVNLNGAHVLQSGTVTATAVGVLSAMCTITSATNLLTYLTNSASGSSSAITRAPTTAYVIANPNAFDITAVWTSNNAGNALQVESVSMEVWHNV
jgi:trimeric autotransporter adhesin